MKDHANLVLRQSKIHASVKNLKERILVVPKISNAKVFVEKLLTVVSISVKEDVTLENVTHVLETPRECFIVHVVETRLKTSSVDKEETAQILLQSAKMNVTNTFHVVNTSVRNLVTVTNVKCVSNKSMKTVDVERVRELLNASKSITLRNS